MGRLCHWNLPEFHHASIAVGKRQSVGRILFVGCSLGRLALVMARALPVGDGAIEDAASGRTLCGTHINDRVDGYELKLTRHSSAFSSAGSTFYLA